jgi:succinylglutamate desuccinylase
VFLLDLHTFSGPGSAFAILDDTLPNREMAMDFPVPLVLGLEEELSGTLASHLTAQGVTVLGFESGQHDDPDSVDGAEAAIWLALDSCGLLEGESRRRAENARNFLKERSASSVGIVEVLYRHPIDSLNGFAMVPGFESFQSVVEGQLLGKGSDGAILAPRPAMLLMPLYQDQGEDGFFLVREIRPVWLPISATMRSWRLERYLHWLPGISRDPDRDDTFTVDRRVARFFALRLFHLLGFRREGKDGRVLVMTRRRDLRE